MNLFITGSNGFIGKNLISFLQKKDINYIGITRESTKEEIKAGIIQSDLIIHLAGSNRPNNIKEFYEINDKFTFCLCQMINEYSNSPCIYASSTQVVNNNDYGKSKLNGEFHFKWLSEKKKIGVNISRLNNIFGKWSKPNYNSVVATFCFNIANNIPIKIDNPNHIIKLSYVEDIFDDWISWFIKKPNNLEITYCSNIYEISVNDLANCLISINENTTPSSNIDPVLVLKLKETFESFNKIGDKHDE